MQSKQGYWPSVDAQITAGTQKFSNNSFNSALGVTHIENFSAGIGLSWEADIWGKVSMRKQVALANYLQTDEVRKAIQTRLVAEVAQGYYNLLSLDEQLKVARRNLELRDSTLIIIRLQYDAGQVNALAVQQSDAQKQSAALLIPALEQQIAIQENALRVISGEYPSAITVLSDLNDFQIPDQFSAGIPADMVRFRPDVKQANCNCRLLTQGWNCESQHVSFFCNYRQRWFEFTTIQQLVQYSGIFVWYAHGVSYTANISQTGIEN
jgi:outer membrane protein TolC